MSTKLSLQVCEIGYLLNLVKPDFDHCSDRSINLQIEQLLEIKLLYWLHFAEVIGLQLYQMLISFSQYLSIASMQCVVSVVVVVEEDLQMWCGQLGRGLWLQLVH